LPELPVAEREQVPGVAEQLSHWPLHAVLQQKPSTQLPVVHTRQPPTRQSAPALALQVCPWGLRGWQLPFGAQ
jgi:hypothetical protein